MDSVPWAPLALPHGPLGHVYVDAVGIYPYLSGVAVLCCAVLCCAVLCSRDVLVSAKVP